MTNSRFTWFNPAKKKNKLDRALANQAWFNFRNWIVLALNRKHSDHKPLILKCSEDNWGPKPFKFFNCLLEDKMFQSHLRQICEVRSLVDLGAKLKKIKEKVRAWNRSIFGNINDKITSAELKQAEADMPNKDSLEK